METLSYQKPEISSKSFVDEKGELKRKETEAIKHAKEHPVWSASVLCIVVSLLGACISMLVFSSAHLARAAFGGAFLTNCLIVCLAMIIGCIDFKHEDKISNEMVDIILIFVGLNFVCPIVILLSSSIWWGE